MADFAVDLEKGILIVTCDCKRVHTINGSGDSFTLDTTEAEPDGKKKESDPDPEPASNPIFNKTFGRKKSS